VGYYGSHIFAYNKDQSLDVDTMSSPETDHNITTSLSLSFIHERLTLENAFTYQIGTTGYALLSELEYVVDDHLHTSLSVRLIGAFDSQQTSLYENWDSNDTVSVSLTYLF